MDTNKVEEYKINNKKTTTTYNTWTLAIYKLIIANKTNNKKRVYTQHNFYMDNLVYLFALFSFCIVGVCVL